MGGTTEQDPGDGSAASRLRARKDRILRRWEALARSKLPGASAQERPALLDSMPEVLDRLIRSLASPSPRETLAREKRELAARHGRERAQERGYSLGEVLQEYDLLRQVLLEVLEEQEALSTPDRDLILDAVQAGVRSAASEFTRLREAERDRAAERLQAANDDLDRRVTERTSELRESEERFRHFVEAVKDYAIFMLDPDGRIASWNAGAERFKGYSAEEAVGRHFSMLYPEDGRRRDEPAIHLKVAASEGRYRGEGLRVRKNGDRYLADVSITPIYEGGALRGFTKVIQDLTERSLLMQERDLIRSDLDRMTIESEYRKRLVATLTHDLRSPLSAAKAAAQMISRLPQDSDQVRTWAHRIGDVVDRTDRMLSDLLDVSRLEAGERLSLKFEPCDLKRLAEEVTDELATCHGSRFRIDAEGPTSGTWSADGLRRVIENLLSNAIKYGDPDSPITLRIRRVEDRVHLSVHNHGTIIPVEEQQKLFRPFHRTRTAEASNQRGWGLGLALVRGIIEAHGGMAKVESYPKEGTTFTVDLPARPPPEPEA